MRTKWQRWLLAGALLALGTALVAGCAQDVGDIDRTQPDKIKKSLFQTDDEWYYRQTVTDVPVQGGGTIWPAYQSSLKKVRWEVTEDTLYAYSTTDPVEGITDDQQNDDDKKLGAVAAFPIESHFDVQRQYNSATGEPTNVIVEDQQDRPWYDREYMRVDWSTNLVDGRGMVGSQLGSLSSTTYQPPQEDDHIDPARARIGEDNIDVTTEYVFQPNVMSCFNNLGYDSIQFCDGARIRVRNSFVPVDVLNPDDYDPLHYPDQKKIREGEGNTGDPLMTTGYYDDYTRDDRGASFESLNLRCDAQAEYNGETTNTLEILQRRHGSTFESCQPESFDYFGRFGYFRTRRVEFDRDRPNTEPNEKYLANRWDIWREAQGERHPQPIIFHLNAQYPKHMMPAADEVERQWNESMLQAVALQLRKNASSSDDYSQDTSLDEMMGEARDAVEQSHELGIGNTNPMAHVKANDNSKMFKIKKNACHPGPFTTWLEQFGAERDADRRAPRQIVANVLGGSPTGDALEESLWNLPHEERVQLCADVEWATELRDKENQRFTYERRGDLRYSLFNWVHEYNMGWSGYGPSSADPDTGEIVSGNANFAGTPLYDSASYGADLIKFMNGELNKQEVIYGSHIDRAIRQAELQQGQALQSLDAEDGDTDVDRREQIRQPRGDYTFTEDIKSLEDLPRQIRRMGIEQMQQEANAAARSAKFARDSTNVWSNAFNKPRIKQLMMQGGNFQTTVEMMTESDPTNFAQSGQNGTDGGSFDRDAEHQAYMDAVNPQRILEQDKRAQRWMAERNMMSADALDRAMTGLVTYRGVAEAFEGMDRQELERYLMNGSFIGTQLHEVGHVLGLRHNFNASMDALNYHDSYWKIQKEVIEGDVAEGTRGIENGNSDGAQTQYAITDSDIIADVIGEDKASEYDYLSAEEFKQASIMDYTADMTGRFAGLGKYDQAAINFAYGGHVRTWDEEDVNLTTSFRSSQFVNDYSQLPGIFGDLSTKDADNQTQLQKNGIDAIINGREWTPIDTVMEERREGIQDTTNKWLTGQYEGANTPTPYVDSSVSYNFCSDRRADYSLGCDTFDHGGNHSEVVQHFIDQYRFHQPFWRYRGQKIDPVNDFLRLYQARVQRTMNAATRPFRYYSIYRALDGFGYDFVRDLRFAGVKGLNLFAEVIAKPEPGLYCRLPVTEVPGNPGARNTVDDLEGTYFLDEEWYYDLSNTYVPNSWLQNEGDCANSVQIPRGPGQYYGYDLTTDYGTPTQKVRRVGTFIDKQLATFGMFNISGNWINSSFITDSRATRVSFWSQYRDRMVQFIGSTIMGDFTGFGGNIDPDAAGTPGGAVYQPPQFVQPEGIVDDGDSSDDENELSPNAPTLKNDIGFPNQVQTLIGSLVLNDSYQDQQVDFSRYIEVSTYESERPEVGDELPESEQWATFTHPITNVTYAAPQVTDGHSISVRLVDWANRLADNYEDAVASGTQDADLAREQLEEVVAKLKMVQEMRNIYTDTD